MQKLLAKIKETDFRKPIRLVIIIALAVALVGGAITAWTMRTQIRELMALEISDKQNEEQTGKHADDGERNTDGEHGDHDGENHQDEQDENREDSDGQDRNDTRGDNAEETGEHDGDHQHEDETGEHDGNHEHEDKGGDYEHGDHEENPFKAGLITRPSTGALVVMGTYFVLCGLCAIAYWLVIAAWLYKASAKAGMHTALWTALGLIGNLLAVVAFLIVRSMRARCDNCDTWQAKGAYCVNCGAPLTRTCSKCNKTCSVKNAYCPDCGTALAEAGATEAEKPIADADNHDEADK